MGPHLQLPHMPVAAKIDGQTHSNFLSGTMGQICEGCGYVDMYSVITQTLWLRL